MVFVNHQLIQFKMQQFKQSSLKLGNLIYIQNNKAYGPRLENGWSDQAPLGIYSTTFTYITQKYGG